MNKPMHCFARIAFLTAFVAFAGTALAGPLTPPAGPVASSGKTLTEVEPRIAINFANTPGDNDTSPSTFKITQPGSYYLTGNILGFAGKHGIEITASGVTLDLNGFELIGFPAMGDFDAVSTTAPNLTNIAVRNGSARSWGGQGINLRNASNSAVNDIRVSSNAGYGIWTNNNCSITNCSASSNVGYGIQSGSNCTITNCTANNNTIDGISTGNGSTISACSARANTSDGISAGSNCAISACAAFENGTSGIASGNASTITGCSASGNSSGIVASSGSTINNCSAATNGIDGIRVAGQCFVLANSCTNNSLSSTVGAGIRTTGINNRIEGNNCTAADRGIYVDAAGNIIIKNTCRGNTVNWFIVAGNAYGPIVATPAGAAVNGNTAAGALGSTDPNANFSY